MSPFAITEKRGNGRFVVLLGEWNDFRVYSSYKSIQRGSSVSTPSSRQYHGSFKRHGSPNYGPISAQCFLQESLMSGFLSQDRYQG